MSAGKQKAAKDEPLNPVFAATPPFTPLWSEGSQSRYFGSLYPEYKKRRI